MKTTTYFNKIYTILAISHLRNNKGKSTFYYSAFFTKEKPEFSYDIVESFIGDMFFKNLIIFQLSVDYEEKDQTQLPVKGYHNHSVCNYFRLKPSTLFSKRGMSLLINSLSDSSSGVNFVLILENISIESIKTAFKLYGMDFNGGNNTLKHILSPQQFLLSKIITIFYGSDHSLVTKSFLEISRNKEISRAINNYTSKEGMSQIEKLREELGINKVELESKSKSFNSNVSDHNETEGFNNTIKKSNTNIKINHIQKRDFHTSLRLKSYDYNKSSYLLYLSKLHNEYVVGFCDAEATFTISVTKDNRVRKSSRGSSDNSRVIYSVHPSFAISLNIKDRHLIHSLQSFFRVGKIKKDLSNNAITFYVNSVEELLNRVIPFFKAHSLLSQKWADFVLFEKAVYLIKKGAHLTTSGLTKIVSIKASMNKGLSPKLVAQFSDISLVKRPVLINNEIRNGNWLAGFADGEGSFYIRVKEASTPKSINRVSFFFSINQSIRDSDLIHKISKFLNCGATNCNEKYIQLRVTKFEDVETKIIPFFKKYPMHGIKNLNYLDFCKIMELVQSNVHITTKGINEIKTIKEGMNLGRT